MSNFLDDLLDEKTATRWITQNTDEWDQVRVGRFTASELWRLMVEPKGKTDKDSGKLSETALSYVQEKVAEVLTGLPKQQGYAFPLVWGSEKEPEAIEYFTERTGLTVEKVGFFTYTDHAGGSPDGFIGEDAILEVKCPYDPGKQVDYLMLTDQWDLKRHFREYYWQCQANLLFTEREVCHFITYDPRMIEEKHKLTHMEVKANADDHAAIIAKLEKAIEEKLKLISLLK